MIVIGWIIGFLIIVPLLIFLIGVVVMIYKEKQKKYNARLNGTESRQHKGDLNE